MQHAASMLLFCFMVCATSCSENSEPKLLLPSDLQVEIILSEDEPGYIDLTAKAQNTNYFSFLYKDGTLVKEDESRDGSSSYTFTTSGKHPVRVRAHATRSDYIEFLDTLDIQLGSDPDTPGPPNTGYSSPMSYPGYTLVWNDEFDGNSLNTDHWNYEQGTGQNGWGNNELQYYLTDNTSVGNGVLTIEARQESIGGRNYTSSRITTQGKKSFKYGRVDIRAALPFGKGIWPALWMLGNSFSTVGWPRCGEIDIMEMIGGSGGIYSDSRVHGTGHWADQNGQRALYGNSKDLSSGTFADEFHVFSIVWNSQSIKWYLDDVLYHELDITPTDLSELNASFFFIFNVAVGGNWPGSPDGSTTFPQRMYVDYIRVFQ